VQQEAVVAIKENAKQLVNDPESPVISDKNGSVTFIEFFDYQCTYCSKMYLIVKQVIATFADNVIIGVGRISYENNLPVLRGMQVAESYQHQGIGMQLLKILSDIIGTEECYCIPHAWLERFYGKICFKKILETEAPLFLQQRIQKNRFSST